MSKYDPYYNILLFGHLFPEIAKNAFSGLTIFNIFWSFLIAVNMHYAKFTLWAPELRILANKLQIITNPPTNHDILLRLIQ